MGETAFLGGLFLLEIVLNSYFSYLNSKHFEPYPISIDVRNSIRKK